MASSPSEGKWCDWLSECCYYLLIFFGRKAGGGLGHTWQGSGNPMGCCGSDLDQSAAFKALPTIDHSSPYLLIIGFEAGMEKATLLALLRWEMVPLPDLKF